LAFGPRPGVGSSYHTALAEMINLYKTELIKPRTPWRTIEEVEPAIAARNQRPAAG
jgi:hypothetical protein